MHQKKLAGLLGLTVLLSACGGSDGPTNPIEEAPQITTQPADVTVNAGETAEFNVVATGSGTLTYQWRRNGVAIDGATSAAYTTPAVTGNDNGAEFSVVIGNGRATVPSRAAVLGVRLPPVIVQSPAGRNVLSGVPATFTVVAEGADLSFQWRRDGVDIPGATDATYTVGVPLPGDNGTEYSVIVSNAAGAQASGNATLTVDAGGGLRPTSYANAKAHNRAVADVPHVQEARAFGDFFGSGNSDYFVATLAYSPQEPLDEAQPGEFRFYRWTPGGYVLEPAKIDETTGCLHPRKAVVADFNEDGQPDIFVACHGYDADPFPGEANHVLLSQPDGVYQSRQAADGLTGFFHSATAFDVNLDGNIDVVVTDNFIDTPVFALLGDGSGNFQPDYTLFPGGRANYFAVEAADVDGDGRTDLLVGGHEWENGEPEVLLADGTGSFATAERHELPAVANEGVVLDFVVMDADMDGASEIYVLRTSGGDGTFYQSRTVQRVTWPDRAGTVLVSERPAQWIDFLHPIWVDDSYALVSDNTQRAFSLEVQ